MKSTYLTTPIYYVNDLPHIGHIYTTVVADTVARYRRLAGGEVYFLTGTDEHGQNIERVARKRGLEPIVWADRVVSDYHHLWKRLGISQDDFVRTTEPRHHQAVKTIIARIDAAGDFYVGKHEGWYCASCENFYTERELGPEKTCPTHETSAEWKSEENLFFRLSRYQQPLLDLYQAHPEFVRPESRLNEVRSFVEGGLRDLSVSRAGLEWGIPFPGRPGQTVYVWLDALTNYLTALGFGAGDDPESAEGAELYRRFWADDAAERLQLMGKDILRFHAVYWPAFLLAAGLPLPTTIWAHGWWLRDEKKISKSVGNIVRPDALMESFGVDTLRYYLLREMVFGQDASFSDEAFVDRYNSDLANDLGNTVSRLVTLSQRAFEGKTPPAACDDNPLIAAAKTAVEGYRSAMDELAFHRALESLWKLLSEANQYFVAREPWKLIKQEEEKDRLSRILWNGLEAVRIVAVGLLPFMPETAPGVLAAIGVGEAPESLDALAWGGLPTSVSLDKQSLFPRIDKEAYFKSDGTGGEPEDEKEAAGGGGDGQIDIQEFAAVELRVATVREAEAVAKSSKLLKLQVCLGEESRQVLAGIAQHYPPEDLVGRQVIVVANLKPAKLMGLESQGMVLAASQDGRPVLLHPESPVPDGTRVR